MKIKKMFKKMVTTGLAVIMMITQVPVTAWADELTGPDVPVVQTETPVEEASPTEQETLEEPEVTEEEPGEPEVTEDTPGVPNEPEVTEDTPEEPNEPEVAEDTPEEPNEPEAVEDQPVEPREPEAAVDEPEGPNEPEAVEEPEDPKEPEAAEDKPADKEEDPETKPLDKEDKEDDENKDPEEDITYPAFEESALIDDVKITVTADEGAFPEGAVLTAQKVTKAQEKEIEEAVENERPEGQNVAISYTYDIKVLDKNGEEIQPAEGHEVKVSFELPHAADENLDANVYHISETEDKDTDKAGINEIDTDEKDTDKTDDDQDDSNEEDTDDLSADAESDSETETSEIPYTAEKLDAQTDEDEETVTVETDGFSFYVVEFTYGDLQYVLDGDSSVSLAEILNSIGLKGNADVVSVSNEELFSASRDGSEWIVKANKPFSSEEWMKISIDGVEYQIKVTDDSDIVLITSWSEMQDAVGKSANKNKTLRLDADIYANGKDRIKIKDKTLTIDLNGHVMDRQRTKSDDDGHVIELQDDAVVTIKDSSPSGTGVITGGYAERGGGIHIGKGTTCIIEGGTIKNNKSDGDGGGIYIRGTLKMTGGAVTDNYADDTGGGIYCVDTGTFDIQNATIANNRAQNDGGAFVVHLKSDASIRNSVISGNKTDKDDGGAIRMDSGKTLNIIDTEISGNEAADEGGGIKVEDGTVKMTGGAIKNNKAKDGGGVYNDDGKIVFENVEISGNSTTEKGGAGVNNKNDANLKNCIIKNNAGLARGGGIYADDDITLEGCTIEGNTSKDEGGGIYFNDVDATVRNCTFKGNHTDSNGGAIRIDDGKINMIDTTITDENSANGYGGGIYIDDDGDVYFSGTNTITENSANYGGGIGVGYDTDTVGVKDTVIVKDNTCSKLGPDVLLRFIDETRVFDSWTNWYEHELKWEELTFTGKLNSDSFIGVSTEEPIKTKSRDITEDYDKYHKGEDPGRYLIADPGYNVVASSDGEAYISTSLWTALQRQIDDAAASGVTLELDQNWKAFSSDDSLFIGADKTVTIDLKGHTINRNRLSEGAKDAGEVFTVHGNLIIKDTSNGHKGKITGGYGTHGGGVYVHKGGSFTLEGGNIEGNKAKNGGGIYNYLGTVNITGGSISRNSSDADGGGVYNAKPEGNDSGTSVLNLSGGKITNNDAGYQAGGVYTTEGSKVNVKDKAYVDGNNAATGKNILLFDNTYIDVVGNIATDAKLDFSVRSSNSSTEKQITRGFATPYTGVQALTYNGKTYNYSTTSDPVSVKNGELYLTINTPSGIAVSKWKDLYEILKKGDNNGNTYYLATDLKADKSNHQEFEVKINVTIDLNGHFVDRNRYDGSVFKIKDGKTLTIKDSGGTGTICGGVVDGDGAGIYVDNGKLVMTGGTIANNKSDDTGGGIYCSGDGTVELDGVTISHNTAKNRGGGLRLHLNAAASIRNCTISNNTAKDDDDEDGGGGISINQENQTLTITDTVISDNTATNGGGIFAYGNSNLVLERVTISGNTATEKGGAGINNTKSTLTLTGCTIKDNTSETTGAGIWAGPGSNTTITGSTITANHAKTSGGGLHAKGTTTLGDNTTITGNSADVSDAGVLAETDLHIKDKVVIFENGDGQNVTLKGDNKLVPDGPLTSDSKISVSVPGNYGVFTNGFGTYHSGDPADFFYSDDGYSVKKTSGGEAEIRMDLGVGTSFIDWTSQITDESRLTPKNWMSGISGDRYLNEINLPCTHDSSMNSIKTHRMSSVGSFFGYTDNAKTQIRYINQQMNEGVRRFDIRLTTIYEKSSKLGFDIDPEDDGVNLYNNHGKDKTGGSFWAKDPNGDLQTLKTILGWVKTFLEEHPTEVIILDIQPEVPKLYFDKDEIPEQERMTYERARTIITNELIGKINPSTGKEYVYWQNGAFKPFTSFPQLKECRGQVIFKSDDSTYVGGIVDTSIYPATKSEGLNGGGTGCSVKEKITVVRNYLTDIDRDYKEGDNPFDSRTIPTDVTRHLDCFHSASVLAAPSGIGGIPTCTPLEAAETIHDELFYNGGPFDQRGKFVGWIRQDGVDAQLNRYIWVSNFPEDDPATQDVVESLHYVTVTAKSSTDDTSPQTYKLLKGTKITIPGNIYGINKILYDWDADVPSGEVTDGSVSYAPGAEYTVMADVTFTADWNPETHTGTPISAVWVDGDGTGRPDSITVTYKKNNDDSSQNVTLSETGKWQEFVTGGVKEITSVTCDSKTISPFGSTTTSTDYYYKVAQGGQGSWIITLYKMPDPPQIPTYLSGSIVWEDYDNADQKRPYSVEVRLKNGPSGQDNKFVREDDNWKWYFNIGTDPMPFAEYQLEEDEIAIIAAVDPNRALKRNYDIDIDYDNTTNKWIITNTLKASSHTHVLKHIDEMKSTCLMPGFKEFWHCEVCGKYFRDAEGLNEITSTAEIISLITGHDLHKEAAVEATCTTEGHIEYWRCNRCGLCFAGEKANKRVYLLKYVDDGGVIIPAKKHSWGEPVYTWAEDNSTATAKRVCKNDSSHVQKETIRVETEVTKEAACETAGEATYTATFKNGAFDEQKKTAEVPALGHAFGEWHVVDESKGIKQRTCERCGKVETMSDGLFSIKVTTDGHGSATASRVRAKGGKKITIKATPKAGYKFSKWKVTKGVKLKNEKKSSTSFTMPAKNVTIKAIFEKVYDRPHAEINPVGDDGIIIKWRKVDEAKGYDIFLSRCNHGGKEIKPKLVKTIKDNKTFSWKTTGLKHKTSYKAYVKAYIKKDGKKKYISQSSLMHVYTTGGSKSYTNAKSIKLNTSDGKIKKNKLTLKAKDTYMIKAEVTKADKKKKLVSDKHVKTLRYYSSDPGIARVGGTGKITAVRKGTCRITVYAHNGVNKVIKVTVK